MTFKKTKRKDLKHWSGTNEIHSLKCLGQKYRCTCAGISAGGGNSKI